MVSAFALSGDLLKPKSFAGLFSAAPSVALATLSLAILREGHSYAAAEARSMMAGAVAFLAYACCVYGIIVRYRFKPSAVSICAAPVWGAVAFGLWYLWLR